MTTTTIFWFALLTAVATGLGALPFFFMKRMNGRWLGLANALAAGLMLAASASLVAEGVAFGGARVLAGAALGTLFVIVSRRWMEGRDDLHVGQLGAVDARKVLLIMGVMTAHSFTEGVGVGVSFGGGEALGAFITAAIALHNVPEGLAIALVMVPRGLSAGRAVGWSILSSLPQPLMAVPAFLFVETFAAVLPVGLGFAAGAMVWMAATELIPEAAADSSPHATAVTVSLSLAAMMLAQTLLLP